MTRINCIPPHELTRQHLVAEYRELPRLFRLVFAAQERGLSASDFAEHDTYRLGPGHVKFFYTRLGWVAERFSQLRAEMLARGYKASYETPPRFDLRPEWFGDWSPDEHAIAINKKRIAERI